VTEHRSVEEKPCSVAPSRTSGPRAPGPTAQTPRASAPSGQARIAAPAPSTKFESFRDSARASEMLGGREGNWRGVVQIERATCLRWERPVVVEVERVEAVVEVERVEAMIEAERHRLGVVLIPAFCCLWSF
jgi:hypothetical protein